MVAHQTSNLEAAGSSPALGAPMFLQIFWPFRSIYGNITMVENPHYVWRLYQCIYMQFSMKTLATLAAQNCQVIGLLQSVDAPSVFFCEAV